MNTHFLIMKSQCKHVLLSCLFLLAFIALPQTSAQAQDARSLLNNTASKLRQAGGISATFNAAVFKNRKMESAASGTIDIRGNMVRMTSSSGTTWYDGKKRWVYQSGSDEAYLSIPTAEEQQMLNPYAFLNIYKSGYKLSAKKVTYASKAAYEIQMKAQNKRQQFSEVLVTLSAANAMPLCVRFRQASGKWVRIQVGSISFGHKWPQSHFAFNAKEHPGVEVVDLR